MKTRFMALLAAVMALGMIPMSADDSKAETAKPEKAKVERKGDYVPQEEWDKMTVEQREAKRAERKAKSEARLKELKDKKAAGTLSDKETKLLERMEAAANRPQRPAKRIKPAQPVPAESTDK